MIRAIDLRVRVGGRAILNGLRFEVERGETVALVGANGSGKTTVLRALLGLVPFEGYASIDGFDVVKQAVAARSRVGYLPQKPAFGDATAAEVLSFVARLRRVRRERASELLERVGLAAHAREKARTFSGGMQQRLSLAVALLADPPVLFLDEPTASLDREGRRTFLEIAASLRAEGRTLLLASHRSDEIARLADRVLHLEEGCSSATDGRAAAADGPDPLRAAGNNVVPFGRKAAAR